MGALQIFTILIRTLLDTLAWIVFSIRTWNVKHKPLPAITNRLLLQSGSSLAEKIRTRQVKSEEIVRIFIERIQSINSSLNAVVETRYEQAMQEARAVDEYIRTNKPEYEDLKTNKPLFGVPISVKECLKLKGFHNTVGLYKWKDNIADQDSESVRIMREAGAIILGTTNIPELVMWWETNNSIYGRTNNPYDLRRMVGGSSGGEASLISAAGSTIGIGTDIGGSIRMPAHFTGIFGHKASKRTISIVGSQPNICELYNDYRTTGPMCRYACDLRISLKLLTAHTDLVNFDKKINMRALKIYYMEDDGGCLTTPVSDEMKGVMHKTLQYFKDTYNTSCEKVNLIELKSSLPIFLAKLGEDETIPTTTQQLTDGEGDLCAEWVLFKMMFAKCQYTYPSLFIAVLRKYLKAEKSSQRYADTMQKFKTLSQSFKEMLTEDAIFLYPSSSTTALYHKETYFKPMNFLYTGIFNVLGLPSTVCPMGLSSSGLPLSVQVIGGLYQDNLCISVAEEIEKAFGGWVCPSEILS